MLNFFLFQTRTRWAGGRMIGACPSHLGRRLWQSFYINMTLTWYAEHIRWDTLNIFVPSFAKHFCTMLNIFLIVVHYRWWKTDTSSLPSDSWWLCSLRQTTAESLIMQVKFIHSILPQFSVAKVTLQSQMFFRCLPVCLSVSNTPQQLELIILHHSSFIIHPSFISRLLSFSSCFIYFCVQVFIKFYTFVKMAFVIQKLHFIASSCNRESYSQLNQHTM